MRVNVCLCFSDENIPLALLLLLLVCIFFCLVVSLHVTFLSVAVWPSRVQCGAAATALTALEETATVQYRQDHDFVFAAQSGVRYDVDVRVGEGSGASVPCTYNSVDEEWDNCSPDCCDFYLGNGVYSCATNLAEGGQYEHYCDRTCGFLCTEDGVTSTNLYVLPPGATDTSQAVATQTTAAADKGLGFTAAATGDFTARVKAWEGSGPVTLTATAVGTAEHRSPPLRADGRPHPLEVSCIMDHCAFGYDGASAYDGDGSGFDLVRDCFGLTVATCSCD
eukprot:COSAG06_NODE_4724_length_4000_cov_23.736221_2_plen_279_part_00